MWSSRSADVVAKSAKYAMWWSGFEVTPSRDSRPYCTVCMYVFMYVCMYVCMYLCIYVSMYVSMYVCMYLLNCT